jgi:hypothetical protein
LFSLLAVLLLDNEPKQMLTTRLCGGANRHTTENVCWPLLVAVRKLWRTGRRAGHLALVISGRMVVKADHLAREATFSTTLRRYMLWPVIAGSFVIMEVDHGEA